MSNKRKLSPGAVKALTGIGIAFGTVIVFFVSFFLSFSFIINPITPISVGAEETEQENKELKTQVKALEDEIELLNTTVEKYRSAASAQVPDEPRQETETKPETKTETETNENTPTNSEPAETTNETKPEESEPFEPETVVTPEGGNPVEVEEPITIIDISE